MPHFSAINLNTVEIMDMICLALENQRDLSCLARTSQDWFSCSIPILWRKIEFKNILKLIPEYVACYSDADLKGRMAEQNFHLSLDRFAIYAQWVTEVIASFPSEEQHLNVFEEMNLISSIKKHLRNSAPLPRLKNLDIRPEISSSPLVAGIGWFFLLLSPSIVDLQFHSYHPLRGGEYPIRLHMYECLVWEFLHQCPGLDKMRIQELARPWNKPGSSYRLSWSDLPLVRLRKIELASHLCETDAFEWLQQLPCLESLHLHDGFEFTDSVPVPCVPEPFPALSKIIIYGFELESLAILFQPFVISRVTKLTVIPIEDVTCEEINDMLSLFAARSSRISQLNLVVYSLNQTVMEPIHLPIIHSLPITHLSLEQFQCDEVSLPGGLRSIYGFWPKLEELHLFSVVVNYEDLIRLSEALPNLSLMEISIPDEPPSLDFPLPSISCMANIKWPNHRLSFTIPYAPLVECSESQLDLIGRYCSSSLFDPTVRVTKRVRILATAWPGMLFRYGFGRDEPKGEAISRAVDIYSGVIRQALGLDI